MKKKICMIFIAVFVAVLGTSTYFIIDHHKESNKQAALYDELAELVDAATQTDAATEPLERIPYSEEKMLLPELAELYQQNGDLVGWISIADTNINYRVMQSVNEPNFYLKHGFDKEYSDYGCPYVQEDCDVQEPSDNLVIYGHHMSNGSMFAHLEKFKSKDFWSEHRMITFNTLTDKQEYEIVAVFRTVVYCGILLLRSGFDRRCTLVLRFRPSPTLTESKHVIRDPANTIILHPLRKKLKSLLEFFRADIQRRLNAQDILSQ